MLQTSLQSADSSSASVWDNVSQDVGTFDERISAQGMVRPHWQYLHNQLASFGNERLTDHAASIQQILGENGITVHADATDISGDRPWKLSAIPFLVQPEEWARLEAGLGRRTRLLETLLHDLLGPQRLIHEGIVPGELVWANPRFHRAYTDLGTERQKLHVVATDLVRDASGHWRITGDRTRAPSGLGYLLENRIVTSRVMAQTIRGCNTKRLASFFASLRDHLKSLASTQRENPRIAILTPPSGSYREFEDTYLARYLGVTLIQGSDLAVRGGKLYLKTLGGLEPIQVLWRHVSDRRCDPLELDSTSNEGVTGLLRCVRNRGVEVVNSVGSVLAETPGLMPYLEDVNRFFFGDDLPLKSVTSFWCGDPRHLSHVISNLSSLIIGSAMAVNGERCVDGARLTVSQSEELIARLNADPAQYVAYERFPFATTPVWSEGRIHSQKAVLRNFQLLSGDDVRVLPGALCRVGNDELELLRSPVSGQMTQDCWVTGEQPVEEHPSLLPQGDTKITLRRGGDELPSRVAEHLFWLGRYAERAECIARTLRTTLQRVSGEDNWESRVEVRRLIYALASMGQIEPGFAVDSFIENLPHLERSLPSSVLDREQPRGLLRTMKSMLHNANAVRDRLSVDAYRIIQRSFQELTRSAAPSGRLNPNEGLSPGEAIERVGTLVVDLLAFAGVTQEGFVRTHAWQFLELGRRIERASQTSEWLRTILCPSTDEPEPTCESLLEITDSLMTYRSRYLNLVQLAPVVDLVVTDQSNPRSVRFQLERIASLMDRLPGIDSAAGLSTIQRLVVSLKYQVTVADPHQLCRPGDDGSLEQLSSLVDFVIEALPKLSEAISARYLIHTTMQRLTGTGR
ncbi:MAG: circularly permuted type 2 ATP-grasp protein [Planctomycetota bacterium]